MPHSVFDEETQQVLQRFGFDADGFEELRARFFGEGAENASNRVPGDVEPPGADDLVEIPAPGSEAHDALSERGRAAIAAGEVGMVVLAGGMATRFGGVVKAAVEVCRGKTFLELKVEDARRSAERTGGRVPVYLMTSFATDAAIREQAARLDTETAPVEAFPQMISVRLTPGGEVFRDDDDEPSLYAPGHGDLTFALRRAGILSRFREAGGKVLFMSNVDNVVATLDPAIVGAHLNGGRPISVECVDKVAGDKGGAPARVDGSLQIVEAFRFPEDFDQDRIPVFNTNTLLFDAEAIDREFELTWFRVNKQVDGQPVVQLERLVGELTAFLPATFLRVPREGELGRFQPAKDPEELDRRRETIESILVARGVLER